jgi:hypothetical protein
MMKRFWIYAFCMAVLSVSGFAGYRFEEVVVEYWAGQGSSQAMIVLDFDENLSFAFGYKWSGVKSSYDALLAVDAYSADFTMISHWEDGVGGYMIDELKYQGATQRGATWSFFTATDGLDWSSSWVGASDRFLDDGDWDGWASGDWYWAGPGDWDYAFSGTVRTPVVPEPAAMGLLGLGGISALRIRRK